MEYTPSFGYENELKALTNAGLRYLVIGGVALWLHRHPRQTNDLDILPGLEDNNMEILVDTLTKFGYTSKYPYVTLKDLKDPKKRNSWITEKNMKAFRVMNSNNEPSSSIDVMIADDINFEEAYKRRKIEVLNDVDIPVASLEDLLALKLKAKRAKDLTDIMVLERFIARRKDDGL